MPFIAGAGATNVDLLYADMPKIPDIGEEVYTNKFSLQLGGGLPATLINAGRLGIEAKIATELGNDIFSEFAKKKFEENNVAPTNLYSGAKICLMAPGGFLDVYRKLKAEGTIMVLDMGWDDELTFEKYGELFEIADYYTPNQKEALTVTGCDNAKDAAYALKKYFDKVVVKVDKDGCIGIDGDDYFFCPSLEQFKNVDSTGAGDAFLAGFIYGLFYDYPLKDCIEFGNITGGKAVTAVGALSAYVNEKELLALKKA